MLDFSRFDAAIFDLDGTLFDSMGLWEQIDRDFLARRGLCADADYIKTVAPMDFPAAARYTIDRFSLTETPGELIGEWTQMCKRAYEKTVPLKPFARDVLSAFKQRGMKLGVSTALAADLFMPALARLSILSRFDALSSRTEVSRGKAFADIYLLTAEKLSVRPEKCVVFEDILSGIRGAMAGGFFTCGVYDPASQADWPEMQKTADASIVSFRELLP